MPSNLDKFDHLVVLMLENRSFDNMLGWLYDPNNAPPFDKVPGGQTFNGVSGKGLINPPYTHPPQTEGPGDGTAPVIHLPDPARLGDNGLDSDAIVRVSQRLGTVLLMVGNNTVRSAVAALRLKGIAVPHPAWSLYNESAGPIPWSPQPSQRFGNVHDKLEHVSLVPYGCSTLRVSAFPTLRWGPYKKPQR